MVTCLEFIAATFVLGFGFHLELTALHDLDRLLGLVTRSLGHVLDLVNDVITLEDLAEDNVATIEPSAQSQSKFKPADLERIRTR